MLVVSCEEAKGPPMRGMPMLEIWKALALVRIWAVSARVVFCEAVMELEWRRWDFEKDFSFWENRGVEVGDDMGNRAATMDGIFCGGGL